MDEAQPRAGAAADTQQSFTVKVADNFHYMDESDVYEHGTFATWAEAVAAARRIVDEYLAAHFTPGISAASLFTAYKSFGDDPYIVPKPADQAFSAWDDAEERCQALCSSVANNRGDIRSSGQPAVEFRSP